MRERYFSLEDASAQLPWLEEIFARLMPLRDELAARQSSLMELLRQRHGNGTSSKEHELKDEQETVERLTSQLRQDLQEITERGIIVRDLGRGLVDFPCIWEGREVFLCWLRGEARIDYWHGTDEGVGSRKQL